MSSQRTLRSRVADVVSDSKQVDYSELEAYADDRYEHLQEKIMEADMDDYEDQLHIVAWKGQQEELVKLLRHFEVSD